MQCNHESSHEKCWLSRENGLLAPHSFCKKCGLVKNMQSDKPRKIGYFASVLTSLRNFHGRKLISKVQIRLILKELEKIEDFEDSYCMSYSTQKIYFLKAVRKFSCISQNLILSLL